MVSLEKQLEDLGLTMDADKFREVIVAIWYRHFPTMTDEQIKDRPSTCALVLVREVRRRVHCPNMPEELILQTLTNIRKNPITAHKYLTRMRARRRKARKS